MHNIYHILFCLPEKIMTYLKKVFRQINSFCKLAQQSWTMPDDPNKEEDLSQKLIEIGNSLSDPDMRTDLALIIQKYREALNIKGGYNDVIKSIDKFINTQLYSIDEDDAEYDVANDLEEALLDLNADLEARAKEAGGGINKGDTAEAHAAINRIQEQFDEEVRENELSGGPSTSDLTQFDPNAISTLDLTGGVDKETAQEKGRGYSVGVVRTPKDWISFYTKEKEKYEEDIKTEKNRRTLEKKQGIITVINQLIPQLEIESRLYEIASTTDDKEINAKLAKVRETIKGLRSQRGHLRAGLRNSILEENITRVQEELSKVRTPKEKLILEQELELQKLLRSPDANKGAETKARKMLLAYLPSMTQSPAGMATLQKLIDNVNAAAAQKISRKEINKQIADEDAKNRGKLPITEEIQKARELAGLTQLQKKYLPRARDWNKTNLKGFISELSKALLAERKTAKDRLVGTKQTKIKEEQKAKFKPYLDVIAAAANSGNRAAMLDAVRILRKAVSNEVPLLPTFSQYVVSVRLSKSFHEYKDALNNLNEAGIEEAKTLSDAEAFFIKRVIERGQELVSYFGDLQVKSIGPKGTNIEGPSGKPLFTSSTYKTILNCVERSYLYLSELYKMKKPYERSGKEKIDPETGEITYE